VILAALATSVWLPGAAASASAPGQEAGRLYEGVAGPYRVTVEVAPPFPIAGKVQFRVRPVEDATSVAVTDAQIEIYLGRDGREELKTPALNSPADRSTYIGNAEIDQVGDWNVRVEVKSNAGSGDFIFAIPVRARVRSGGGLVGPTFVYLGAAVLILVGAGWLVLASRRARGRPAS
jgi:hypothetical protein